MKPKRPTPKVVYWEEPTKKTKKEQDKDKGNINSSDESNSWMGNSILESDYSQSFESKKGKKDKKKEKKKGRDDSSSSGSGGSSDESDSLIEQEEIPDDLKLPDIQIHKRYEIPFIP